jgi:hypothetical protein
MSESKININLGPSFGFMGLLSLLFIGLKLGHVIDWSWWWVTCPIWIGMAFWLGIFILFIGFALVIGIARLFFK